MYSQSGRATPTGPPLGCNVLPPARFIPSLTSPSSTNQKSLGTPSSYPSSLISPSGVTILPRTPLTPSLIDPIPRAPFMPSTAPCLPLSPIHHTTAQKEDARLVHVCTPQITTLNLSDFKTVCDLKHHLQTALSVLSHRQEILHDGRILSDSEELALLYPVTGELWLSMKEVPLKMPGSSLTPVLNPMQSRKSSFSLSDPLGLGLCRSLTEGSLCCAPFSGNSISNSNCNNNSNSNSNARKPPEVPVDKSKQCQRPHASSIITDMDRRRRPSGTSETPSCMHTIPSATWVPSVMTIGTSEGLNSNCSYSTTSTPAETPVLNELVVTSQPATHNPGCRHTGRNRGQSKVAIGPAESFSATPQSSPSSVAKRMPPQDVSDTNEVSVSESPLISPTATSPELYPHVPEPPPVGFDADTTPSSLDVTALASKWHNIKSTAKPWPSSIFVVSEYDNNVVYCAAGRKGVMVYDLATGSSWTVDFEGVGNVSASEECLVVGGGQRLCCWDIRERRQLWEEATGEWKTLATSDGLMVAGDSAGDLWLHRIRDPTKKVRLHDPRATTPWRFVDIDKNYVIAVNDASDLFIWNTLRSNKRPSGTLIGHRSLRSNTLGQLEGELKKVLLCCGTVCTQHDTDRECLKKVLLWDAASGAQLTAWQHKSNEPGADLAMAVYGVEGDVLIAVSNSAYLRLIRYRSGGSPSFEIDYVVPNGAGKCLSLSFAGPSCIVAAHEHTVLFWQCVAPKPQQGRKKKHDKCAIM
eukprot:TRINITY_DN16387_c0_g1_i2.p1 TRINITY_DN16387_c0_g1~~TRINITY_DN16387_c0_g1_i2.p1  ORF type:complete len:834 (+),score=159.83 TRINITY_DN16387_c0_g1_i2:247-2502(+)